MRNGTPLFDDETDLVWVHYQNHGLNLTGYTLSLEQSDSQQKLTLWSSGAKQPLASTTFTIGVDTFPRQVFVEGYELGMEPLELAVADNLDPANAVTAITDAAIRDLYVGGDENDTAEVDISAMFNPMTFGAEGTGSLVHLTVKRSDDVTVLDDDFSEAATLQDVALQAIDGAQDFTVKAWLDADQDGLLDPGEEKREVDVHVVTVKSLTVAHHTKPGNSVTASDSAIQHLYVGEDGFRKGADNRVRYNVRIDLSAAIEPATSPEARKLVHWSIQQDGFTSPIMQGDFANGTTFADKEVDLTDDTSGAARDFTVTVWVDKNRNGQLDGDEAKRIVKVHDTAIPAYYPTVAYKGVMLTASIEVDPQANVLSVKVDAGPAYKRIEDQGWSFYQVMDGTHPTFNDTDSAQFAVQWTAGNEEVGHFSNAVWLKPTYQGLRDVAALWTRGGEGAGKFVSRDTTAIPAAADHVTVVLVYTDGLYNTPADYDEIKEHGNGNGDMPDIIGYWTGDRDATGWHFSRDVGKVLRYKPDQQTRFDPHAGQIKAAVCSATTALADVGYSLETRPTSSAYQVAVDAYMSAWINGKPNANRKRVLISGIWKAINKAAADDQIKTDAKGEVHDTGFDIMPKPGDPGYPAGPG